MSAMIKNMCRLLPLKTSASTFIQVGLHSSAAVQAKVAVVLAGCGVYDGSEVHEASAILVHLSREGAQAQCFAPDQDQLHVINHTKGEPMEETRNCMVEAARIARGNIQCLSNLQAADYDAVIFPGGFGAAKNLCTFAVDGTDMKVDEEVGRVVKAFHQSQKPIGMCCIAPVLAAKLIPGVELTVGHDQEEGGRWPYAGTAAAIQQLGAKHVNTSVHETHTDDKNRIVTTAAFMCETAFHEIYDGIGKLVKDLLKLTK